MVNNITTFVDAEFGFYRALQFTGFCFAILIVAMLLLPIIGMKWLAIGGAGIGLIALILEWTRFGFSRFRAERRIAGYLKEQDTRILRAQDNINELAVKVDETYVKKG